MSTRVLISLSPALLVDLDKYSKKYNYNRSEFVRESIRQLLTKYQAKEKNESA